MGLTRRKYIRAGVQMPMTALIDIVFLLLIYFLLTTNYLASDTLPIDLPRAETGAPAESDVLTITVDDTGEVRLDGATFMDKELFIQLQRKLVDREGVQVVVRADRAVPLERVVTVLDVARACGAGRLSLATEHELHSLSP